MKFGFIGGSYTLESMNAECQETINWYPEAIESGKGKDVAALSPTSGLSTFATLTGASVRVLFELNGRCFGVAGSKFYEILSDGSEVDRGNVSSDSLPASISAFPHQLLVISGGAAYAFDLETNVLSPVIGMLGVPVMGGFVDGSMMVLLKDSAQFQFSALEDATLWDGADTGIVSVFPDNAVSMLIDHREIWLMGRKASQVYWNSGTPDNPFEPIPGGFIEHGCIARSSVVRLDNSIFWLGGDERGAGIAWRAEGYRPARISNHATETEWQGYSTMADAVAYAYQDRGHSFYVLNFPTAGVTWVYDVATGMWAKRGFWNLLTAKYEAHLGQCHCYAFGKHLVGDRQSGKVYEMSSVFHDDAGAAIRRLRRAPHVSANGKPLFVSELFLDLETGLGLPVGQGSDPQVMLRWSNDGAKTWSSEYKLSAGKIGEHGKRVVFRRLGMTRKTRVFEVSVTDPVPWRIADAEIEVEVGS